jgi:hypothetical protein
MPTSSHEAKKKEKRKEILEPTKETTVSLLSSPSPSPSLQKDSLIPHIEKLSTQYHTKLHQIL